MITDQLTKAERLRLESLSQAANITVMIKLPGRTISIEEVFEKAKQVEAFLKEANPSDL